jgi:DNA-binding LytR/AlgR family response regulator
MDIRYFVKVFNYNNIYMDNLLRINRTTTVNKNEIIFLEAASNYTCIHTVERQVVSTVTMKEVIRRVKSINFLQINRGLQINKDYISSTDLNSMRPTVLMANAKKLPISRRRLQFVMENLN